MAAENVALVTGAQGFIGRHLVRGLLAEGWSCVGVDRQAPGPGQRWVPSKLRCLRADVAEPSFRPLLVQIAPQCVVHLAAQSSLAALVDHPVQGVRDNVLATENVLQGCVEAGVRRVVFASSAAVYGSCRQLPTPESAPVAPESAYGWSKIAGEQLVQKFAEESGVTCTVLRLANCYGPGQEEKDEAGVIVGWLQAMARGSPLRLAHGHERTRDFVYISDVVEALIAAMTSEDWGVFNVGTGRETGLTELAVEVARTAGGAPVFERCPAAPGDIERSTLSPALAKRVLSWAPKTSLETGLAYTWRHLLAVRRQVSRAAGSA